MSRAQIIITAIFVVIGSGYYITSEDIEAKHKLEVVYNNQVVETIVSDEVYENIQLRQKAGLDIYFDGEYFFESTPVNKDLYKAKIIGWELVNGEIPRIFVLFWGFMFYIGCMVFTIPDTGEESLSNYY